MADVGTVTVRGVAIGYRRGGGGGAPLALPVGGGGGAPIQSRAASPTRARYPDPADAARRDGARPGAASSVTEPAARRAPRGGGDARADPPGGVPQSGHRPRPCRHARRAAAYRRTDARPLRRARSGNARGPRHATA